jgi:ketosteroid isomerase-like protein
MSQESVALVYRGAEAFNRRDLDAFLALNDADVEFTSRFAELEGGGPYRGHDGIRSWWENVCGIWSDVSVEIGEARDLGDVIVTRLRFRGHGIESDAPWEQTQWQVAEWRHSSEATSADSSSRCRFARKTAAAKQPAIPMDLVGRLSNPQARPEP